LAVGLADETQPVAPTLVTDPPDVGIARDLGEEGVDRFFARGET